MPTQTAKRAKRKKKKTLLKKKVPEEGGYTPADQNPNESVERKSEEQRSQWKAKETASKEKGRKRRELCVEQVWAIGRAGKKKLKKTRLIQGEGRLAFSVKRELERKGSTSGHRKSLGPIQKGRKGGLKGRLRTGSARLNGWSVTGF